MTYILSLVAAVTVAHADWQNPNLPPMGEVEALIANTGVAIEGSTGAVIYNPAGLAALEKNRLTASGNAYAVIEAKVATDSGDPLSYKEFTSVPSMIVGSRRLKNWTGAFAILSPAVVEINMHNERDVPALGALASSVINSKTEENYFGISGARKLSSGKSFGFSVFAHRQNDKSVSGMQIRPTTGTLHGAITSRRESENYSLLALAGLQDQVNENLRWGLKVQTESLQLAGEIEYYEEVLVTTGAAPARSLDQGKKRSNVKLPWQIDAGIERRFGGRHTWLFDLGITLPMVNHSAPNTKYNDAVTTKTTFRANTGYLFALTDKWKLTSGVQYNPSNIASATSGEGMPRQNFIGATLGLFNSDGNVTTGAGLFYLTSRTDKKFFQGDADDPTAMAIYGIALSTGISY